MQAGSYRMPVAGECVRTCQSCMPVAPSLCMWHEQSCHTTHTACLLNIRRSSKSSCQPENNTRLGAALVLIIIITCHDILPPSRRVSHVKSDYARTNTQHTLNIPKYTRLDLQLWLRFNSLLQRHRVTVSHPSTGYKPLSSWGRSDKISRTNGCVKLKHLHTFAPGISTPSYLLCIVVAPTIIPPPHTIHPP